MDKQLSIIDIFSGIGGMSKGFLDAGYQIHEAIDSDEEKVSIYNRIIGAPTAKCRDIRFMDPEKIKNADIIAGRIPFNSLSFVERKGLEGHHSLKEGMISFVREKRPKAIVLVESVNAKADYLHEIYDGYTSMGYHIYYKKLAGQNYSGLSFYDVKNYIVGIRDDFVYGEFYFPAARYDKDDIDTKGYIFEKNVEPWYTKINKIERYKFDEKKIYVRRMNRFYESDLIMDGIMYENFLSDSSGLRRCTHLEMARLKGLAVFDYNDYKNKRLMYRYIAQETNAIVISYIAKTLREYLSGKEAVDNTASCFSKKEGIARSNMRLLEPYIQNENAVSKGRIDERYIKEEGQKEERPQEDGSPEEDPQEESSQDVFLQDGWDELIGIVNDEAVNHLERGRALEKLMLKFFSRVEGFQCEPNARTETEEIDIWILNESKNGLFSKESNLILCECKNWKKDVKRSELNVFIEKMKNRNGRCKLGFFVAWNGVTSDFNKELLRITRGEEVVVLLTKEGILSAIKTGAITNYLQHEYSQALLR